ERTLELLRIAKKSGMVTKSGLMLGLGETDEEVIEALRALRAAGCELITLGQYRQPTRDHLPVVRWVPPDTFERLGPEGLAMCVTNVFAGPLVRSSYHAEEQALSLSK